MNMKRIFTLVFVLVALLSVGPSAKGQLAIDPLTTGTVTRLPGGPLITDLDGTKFTQQSSSNFTIAYQLPTEYDWDGVMVRWEDWGPRDLTAITTFVFAVRGTANKVKVEFEATNATKTIAVLQSVTNTWQFYHIPATAITNNLGKIKVISFVTDWGLAGTVKTGTCDVLVQGLVFDWRLNGSDSGAPSALPNLPKVVQVGGANPGTIIVNTNPSVIDVSYDVHGGWSGATIAYDDLDTWPITEYENLTGFTNLVFGLWGDARNVKVEFLDKSNSVMIAVCTNVGPTVKYYTFELGLLTNQISAISAINFVVDSNLVAAGSLAGRLYVQSAGLNYNITINGQGSGAPTVLPSEPALDKVGGANSDTIVSLLSDTNFIVHYTVTSGWSGASILYDDYATPGVESGNLSGYASLVFGLAGSPANVKCEIQDADGHKLAASFTNVGPALKYYSLSATHLTNKYINRSAVTVISFVIDSALAGAGNVTGSLTVATGGLKYPLQISPLPAGALTTLPPTPFDVTPVGGANPDTQVDQYSSGRFRVYYSVTSGWSGASILYDDFGSVPIETGNFAGLTSVIFAVQGAPSKIKVEFEDSATNKASGELLGVSGDLQYYRVDIGTISNKGVHVQSVRMINFVVDSNLVGAANISGKFEVFTAGLTYRNLIFSKIDSDGDGLPDFWEEANGMDPEDNGSINPDNGKHGDIDGDGVDNETEYVAGTDASGDASAPVVEVGKAGSNMTMSIDGFSRREYRFYRTDNIRTGAWTRVGPVYKYATNGPVQFSDDLEMLTNWYYRCSIKLEEVSRLVGRPQLIVVGGGETNTVVNQLSSGEFLVQYNVTQGWAGVTFLYDDYGTPAIETKSFAGYSELTFAISGTPQSVKYEFVDSHTNSVVGWFENVTNRWSSFTIDTALLTAQGLDLSQIRFFNFLVDAGSAGSSNVIGSFGVRTWGLAYAIESSGSAAGSVTTLRPAPPAVGDVGGGQSTNQWVKYGVTNVYVPYNVTPADTWDGISISYDSFGTPQLENSDYSETPAITFGVKGTPRSVKVEFEDIATNKVVANFRSVTNTLKYYTVRVDDLEAAGLNPAHMRFINFVIDQAAAGTNNYVGNFSVVTDGLAP